MTQTCAPDSVGEVAALMATQQAHDTAVKMDALKVLLDSGALEAHMVNEEGKQLLLDLYNSFRARLPSGATGRQAVESGSTQSQVIDVDAVATDNASGATPLADEFHGDRSEKRDD